MPCYSLKEIEILKRRHHPVTVRSLTMMGKTRMLRQKKAYAVALGLTVKEMVRQIEEVPPELGKHFRRLVNRPMGHS